MKVVCSSRAREVIFAAAGMRRSGQAAVEYMLVAGMLIAAVVMLSVFLYTFREHSGRVLDLVASEYP